MYFSQWFNDPTAAGTTNDKQFSFLEHSKLNQELVCKYHLQHHHLQQDLITKHAVRFYTYYLINSVGFQSNFSVNQIWKILHSYDEFSSSYNEFMNCSWLRQKRSNCTESYLKTAIPFFEQTTVNLTRWVHFENKLAT